MQRPIDLHLSLDVDPRALLGFEDEGIKLDDVDDEPPTGFTFPLLFTWTLPPLPQPPDLLVLATELAGVGGLELPVEVSAIDSFPSVTDAPERSLSIVARMSVDLADVYLNNDGSISSSLERCKHVSLYLLERADAWLRKPNEAATFGGKSALERMLSGNVADLFVVRQYLDAQRG